MRGRKWGRKIAAVVLSLSMMAGMVQGAGSGRGCQFIDNFQNDEDFCT